MARVLVIDDQEPIRRIVRRALESAGYEVVEASEGEKGMALIRHAAVDVVITDIFMPGQDGITTLLALRKEFPAVKVLAMSGGSTVGQLDLREDARLLGAMRILSKPFSPRDVIEAVRSVLQEK